MTREIYFNASSTYLANNVKQKLIHTLALRFYKFYLLFIFYIKLNQSGLEKKMTAKEKVNTYDYYARELDSYFLTKS